MSKKKTRVNEQCDSLLNKLQPGFRTKKKEAIEDFSVFFFGKRSETVSKDDVTRLFVGEGKRIGLLAICGKRSKSSGAMQVAAGRAVDLVAGLMDKTKNATDWFLFQQVFLSLDTEYVKLMCLSEHDSTPTVLALRNYLKNADQFRAEAGAAERAANPAEDVTRPSSLDLRESVIDLEEKKVGRGLRAPDAATPRKPSATTVAAFKRERPGSGTVEVLRPAEQFELRDKMNIRDKLSVFLAARKNDEQLIKMGVLVRGATFGLPLQDVVKRAGRDGIPNIVRALVDCMKTREIVKLHGVFRINGEMGEIQTLKRIYDFESEKELDLNKYEPHALTGCLKMFLRELPDPLFTYERYDAIVDAYRQGNMTQLSEIVQTLPPSNLATWNYILDMLVICHSHSATNMMTAKNLALVMSPNILRLKVETFAKIAQDTPVTVGAVEHLINARATKLGISVLPAVAGSETKDPSKDVKDEGSNGPVGSVGPVALPAVAGGANLKPLLKQLRPSTTADAGAPVAPPSPKPEAAKDPSPGSPWVQYMDNTRGIPYYHNTVTKETVWLKPPDF